MKNRKLKISLLLILITYFGYTQTKENALEIVTKSDKIARGNTSYAEVKITSVRPKWSKEMKMKIWSKGSDYSASLVMTPAKEKGSVFLKRKTEVWNYVPSIERTIKLPPSMMMQNWMGTDMTNDDMVKQSSIVVDYTHKILGSEKIIGLDCWKLELIPKEDAAVVWGKIIMWVDKTNYMQLKIEFYDEDDFLVNKLIGTNPKKFGKRTLPAKIEYIPVEKEGSKTIIEYNIWKFDLKINDSYFTSRYMKRLR